MYNISDITDGIGDIKDGIKDVFKTYIKPIPNPNALSIAMVGLSSLILVYFVAYKEDPPAEGESSNQDSSNQDSPSQDSRSLESRSLESRSLEGDSRRKTPSKKQKDQATEIIEYS